MDFYSVLDSEYQRLSGRSRIWGRPLNGFLIRDFPIKAPTRQMLYPLSYRGALPMSRDVSMSTAIQVNRTLMVESHSFSGFKIKETDPQRAVSLVCKTG